MSLVYNATFDKNTRKLSFEDKAGNEIYSFTVPERAPAVDDIAKPLTFRAKQDGSTVELTKEGTPSGDFQTSTDGGNTWTDYTIDTAISLNTGDEVSFRAKADRTSAQSSSAYFYFYMTGKIEAWHNVMSLYRTNDFATYNTVVVYAFYGLFPGYSSLTKAPVLPATTLADSCYQSMFSGCQSLTKAPELPATALADYCYAGMFLGCTSLAKAPELPATALATRCYYYMFSRCQSLNEVRIAATTTATDALKEWLKDVSATGDFYCDPNATIFPTDSTSGIPAGWNRIPKPAPTPAVDDITKPLTLRATSDNSSVKLAQSGTVYNKFEVDKGNGWEGYTIGEVIHLNAGESCKWRCTSHPSTQTDSRYVRFGMTGTIEASGNCNSMLSSDFENITSLSKYDHAFVALFKGCKSLTKAPALPATTLSNYCYFHMFDDCNSLKEVRISATKTATGALTQWLTGVSATGDFYCDPNATFSSGSSGIPENWTRHALADYPVNP